MARDRSNYVRKPPMTQFPTGLPYGQAAALEQQAAALPAAPRRPIGPPPTPAAPPAPAQPFSLENAVAQMAQLPRGVPLNAPTQNPGEPLMAGVNAGPGPGSEVLPAFARPDRTLDVFNALAEATGDSAFSELAELARGR